MKHFLQQFWIGAIAIGMMALFGWVLPSPVQAAAMAPTQQVQSLQALEDALFTVHYDQEPIDSRLGRLEQTIFGQAQTGTADSRITKLQKVLSPGSLGPLSPTAKPADKQPVANSAPETASNTNTIKKPVFSSAVKPNKSPAPAAPATAMAPQSGETDYPTVSQMEQKVFGKTFAQEDITQRLPRLEKQVFNNAQNGILSDRVDNLRLVVLGDTGNQQPMSGYIPPNYYAPQSGYGNNMPNPPQFYMPNQSYNSPFNSGPVASGSPNQGYPGDDPSTGLPNNMNGGMNSNNDDNPTPDMLSAISEIEKEVMGQQYTSEPFTTRLDRLENKIFHVTSPEMPTEDRIQRITAVASAGGAPESPKTKAKHTLQSLLPIILTILPLVLL